MGLLNIMRRINAIETRLSYVENNTLKKIATHEISASDSALSIELDSTKTYVVEVMNTSIPSKSLFTLQYTLSPNWNVTVIGGSELSNSDISVTTNNNGITVKPFTEISANVKKVTIYELN